MAYATKYKVFFSDISNNEYQALIKFDGYLGSENILEGTGNACIINYDRSDDKFNAVNGSGCTLNFYNNGLDLSSLFVVDPFEAQLIIQKKISEVWTDMWCGWINPEVYSENYSWDRGEVKVTANDGFSAIKRSKFFTESYEVDDNGLPLKPHRPRLYFNYGTAPVLDVLSKCFDDINISKMYIASDTRTNLDLFHEHYIDLANFVDEDNESLSKREVLDFILKPMTLKCYKIANDIYIFDPCLQMGTVSFLAFDKVFQGFDRDALSDMNLILDVNHADGDFSYLDGGQTKELVAGFKTIISNYSAYPDIRKVIPYNPEDITPDYPDTLATSWGNGNGREDSSGSIIDYMYTRGGYLQGATNKTYLLDNFYVEFGSNGGFYQYTILPEDFISNIPDDYGKRYYGMHGTSYNPSSPSSTDPDSIEIKFHGGWIPSSTDEMEVKFNVLLDMHSFSAPSKSIDYIGLPITARQRNENGSVIDILTIDYYNPFSAPSDFHYVYCKGAGVNGFRNEVEFSFKVTGFTGGGFLEILIGGETRTIINDSGNKHKYISNNLLTLLSGFEVYINGLEISDDDLEYKSESDIEYTNSKTIEINQSSRRLNGILDRGCFIATDNSHATTFYRQSVPSLSGSMGFTISQAYLSNYKNPFLRLNAEISDINMFVDSSGLPNDSLFTPMTVLKDSNEFSNKRFIFMGGNINICQNTIDGIWDELFYTDNI